MILFMPFAGMQESLLAATEFEVFGGGAAGPGKALTLDTPIPTPTGWTTMGALQVGDRVLDETGRPCVVVAATEVMHGHRVYDVEFDDGSVIRADAEHSWLTMTAAERESALRRTPEFRARRRETRPLRGRGLQPWLTERNKAMVHEVLEPSTGQVRTTEEIAATVRLESGRRNHSVALTGALDLPNAALPLDPYVLGVWLGDGSSNGGQITSADAEVIGEVSAAGWEVKKLGAKYLYGVAGLAPALRSVGVLCNKHIPAAYLRASRAQRLALLQGLMDTDGCCGARDGCCEFCNTNQALAEGVLELALSLGIKARLATGRATLYGKDCGPKYRVTFTTDQPVFRLPRKLAALPQRLRDTQARRYIVDVREVPTEPVRCIAVSSASHLFLAGRAMIPTHNSLALLVDGLRYIGQKSYRALILRSSFPELQELMDRADEMFPDLGGVWNENDKRWTFPSGATYEFGYLTFFVEVKRYRGQEYAFIGYDEIGDLAEERTWTFLATRCRTKDRRIPPRVRCTANPGGIAHAWLRRRFIVTCGEDGARVYRDPKTGLLRRFLPGRLTENPALLANNPDYVKQIRSNPDIIVRQLEHGDWTAGTGAALDELSESRHIIPPIPIPSHWRTWGAFDWGFRHPFAFGLFAQNEDGDVFLVDSVHGRLLLDDEIAARIGEHFKALVLEDAEGAPIHYGNLLPRFTVAGHDCWHDIKARSEHGPTTADTFAKAKIPLMRANISRVSGLKNVRNYLKWRGQGPNGSDGVPQFRMFDTPGNRKVFTVLESLVSDPDNMEDTLKVDADGDGSGGDDAADMVRYGLMQRPLQVKAPDQKKVRGPHYDSGYDRLLARAAAGGRTRRGF